MSLKIFLELRWQNITKTYRTTLAISQLVETERGSEMLTPSAVTLAIWNYTKQQNTKDNEAAVRLETDSTR
jgi:hypothetical protein